MCVPVRRGPVPLLAGGSEAACGRRTVTCMVQPDPSVLSAQMCPPISSARRLQMLSPSPVPPYFLVVEESTCVKFSKIVFSLQKRLKQNRNEEEDSEKPKLSKINSKK